MSNIINLRTRVKEKSQEIRYAVALGRVSDTRQKQKNISIPAQKSRIEDWADKNNVVILKWDEFDHSAFRDLDAETRFTDLMNYAIRDRKVSLFLVDEKSRFARDRYTRVVYEEKLRRAGVKLIGVNEPDYDRKSIHGVWMEGISITKNEAMSVEIAYHVMKGMTENAGQRDPVTGWCYKNGGFPPDGYKNTRVVRGKDARGKDIVKLIWEIDEERSKIIRFIVLELWMNRGMSWKAMRDYLNSDSTILDGVIGPTYSVKGNIWGGSSIREICIRALEGVYSGLYYWNRTGKDLRGTGTKWKDITEWTVIENAHTQIITTEEWEQLKSVRGPSIEARKGKGTANPKTANSRWLLSGKNALGEDFFVCLNGNDESPHHLVSAQMGKDEWYLCGTYRNKGLAGCNKPFYVDKSFENTVFKAILKRFSTENISQLVEEVNNLLQADVKDIAQSKKHIQKLISDNDKKARELVSALSEAGTGAKKFILSQLDELAAEKESHETQLIELEKEKPELNLLDESAILNYIKRAPLIWQNGTNAEKREFLRRFIYNLELDPDKGTVYINFFVDPFRSKAISIKKKVSTPTARPLTGISKHARSPAPRTATRLPGIIPNPWKPLYYCRLVEAPSPASLYLLYKLFNQMQYLLRILLQPVGSLSHLSAYGGLFLRGSSYLLYI